MISNDLTASMVKLGFEVEASHGFLIKFYLFMLLIRLYLLGFFLWLNYVPYFFFTINSLFLCIMVFALIFIFSLLHGIHKITTHVFHFPLNTIS